MQPAGSTLSSSFHAADRAVQREAVEQQRDAQQERDVHVHQLLGYSERCNQRGEVKDEEHVENSAADNIAQCNVGLCRGACLDDHHEFWRTGAKRNDRQANYQGRDADRNRNS